MGSKTRVPRIAGLARERVDHRLAPLWQHRLGLVVAPAGSGKTTLLAQFATGSGVPVAWWRAEAADGSEEAVAAHLGRALAPFVESAGGWRTIDDVAAGLDAWSGERALLVVDDLHAIWGTAAEAALERLIALAPPGIVVLAATRRPPGFNLSRMAVSGELLELGQEDLRFRAWEVERLFRDFYDSPMPPNELAELARRTAGWAAGLQLFHLATRGKPAAERRKVLAQLGTRSRLREYLARNVLDDLALHVRDFLVQTCVLGRLDAGLCDELTGATSGAAVLDELERRQIFTAAVDGEGSYRYHEVLRSHLEAVLVEQVGEKEARQRFRRAGALLEAHGHAADALRAFARAEAWESVTRLVGGNGEALIDQPGEWLDALPAALVDQDPWLLLGTARRLLAAGRPEEALDVYQRGEAAAGTAQPGDVCRRERQAVLAWFSPAPLAATDWLGALRLATAREPAAAAALSTGWPGPEAELAAGLALLLAGSLHDARARLEAIADRADASDAVATASSVAALAAAGLAGEPVAAGAERLGDYAERAGLVWLANVARAVALVDPDGGLEAGRSLMPKHDPWAAALVRLLEGVGLSRRGMGVPAAASLVEASDGFRALDAPVLAAWADAVAAAATGTASAARAAQRAARRLGVSLPALACHADPRADAPAARSDRRIAVRCLGNFELTSDGAPVDLGGVKPRVRSLLRLLALHAPGAVHRERVIDALWPDESDTRTGLRNLQVAVSSLRQLLEPGVARGEAAIVVRDGDGYRLAIDADGSDLRVLWREIGAGRSARAAGDEEGAARAFGSALAAYRGDVLVDEGAAEWVLAERDRAKAAAAEAAEALAEIALGSGDAATAVAAASDGLQIDPYRDGLWRALVRAHEAAGDVAAARRAEARYGEVLEELGLA